MRARKGCVDRNCTGYMNKKVKYNKDSEYCVRCGKPLYYVCSDCWTVLDDNKEKYCIICKNKRKDKRDDRVEKVKNAGKTGGAAVAAVGGAVAFVAKHLKDMSNHSKEIVEVVKEAKDIIRK